MAKQRPYVIIYVTSSVDGKIASKTGYSKLSCPYDLRRLHEVRALVDAVIVGARTVAIDNPLLTVRYVNGKNPVRVIIDGKLSIPETARVLNDRSAKTIIITSNNVDTDKVKRIKDLGVDVIQLGNSHYIDPSAALSALQKFGINIVLVEGGGNLIWSFVEKGLIDEFRITYSPTIIGGRDAITPVEGEGFSDTTDFLKLTPIQVKMCECGEEIHIIYKVKKA
jgi:2,5-diamino-6-(ribosylamino)-4(3H)-pyrimidinone 5'-phosphate reductase